MMNERWLHECNEKFEIVSDLIKHILDINPFMPSGHFGPIHFQQKGCLVSFYYYHTLMKFLYLMQNSVDIDQTPRSARLNLVYPVSQCPFCRTLGINGLRQIPMVVFYTLTCQMYSDV